MKAPTVNLIEEDDTRLSILGLLKQDAELSFRLTNPLAEYICTFTHEECWNEERKTSMTDPGLKEVSRWLTDFGRCVAAAGCQGPS